MNKPEIENIADIIEQAKRGNNEAFSCLYTTYFSPVYRYVYFRITNKAEVSDVVQEVFLKAYTSFSNYSYSGKSPLAFFYTIARNIIIDASRKKKISSVDIGEEAWPLIRDKADTPEEWLIKKEEALDLRNKIAFLPEDQQEVIILRFIEELETKEISTILEKSEEAVRQLQSRGLKSLRKIYNN